MFEIDKKKFGEFLAERRKAKGYTQKELADKLYVSDKAVSKWERALSMPDISLLMPLAEILDVSVTELLEGRRLEDAPKLDAGQVESLVKKALSLSEDSPERKRERMKKHAGIFGGCTLLALLELLTGLWILRRLGNAFFPVYLFVLEGLGFGFGVYFWFLAPRKLPDYYDENRISSVRDGLFSMNFPGLYFNNSNWMPIVKTLRVWSVAAMLSAPVPCFICALASGAWWSFGVQNVLFFCFLLGMFVPVYIVGRKYGGGKGEGPSKAKRRPVLLLFLLLPVFVAGIGILGTFPSGSAVRVGYVSNDGLREWSARYRRLDGTMEKRIYPASGAGDYVIEVTTEAGALSVEIRDSSGSVIFNGEELPTGVYPVKLSGKVQVRVAADSHKGSFAIRPR